MITARIRTSEARASGVSVGAGSPTSVWLPGVIAVLGLGLTRLGARELWVDEAFSLAATHDLVETIGQTHGTMSLYYVLLTPWVAFSDDAAWVRLLSLLLMGVAAALLAVTVARQHGATAGRWAGLVVACSYLPARLALEARSYALVAVLSTLSWYALDRVLTDDRRRRWWRVSSACVVLLPLAHGLGAIQVVAQVLAVAWARPDRPTQVRHLLAAAASGAVVVALLTAGIEGVGDWLDPLSVQTLSNLGAEVLHPLPVLALTVVALAIVGQLCVTRQVGQGVVERFRKVSLVLWGPGALALVIALSAVRPSHLARYSLSASMGVAGLVGVALAHLPGRSRAHRVAAGTLVLALLLTSHLAIVAARDEPWTRAADLVAAQAQDGDGLLFTDPEVRLPFEAAWEAGAARPAVELVEPGGELGSMDRFTQGDPTSDIGDSLAPGTRIWLVHQDLPHATNRRQDLVDDPELAPRFTESSTWSVAPDIEIRLLVVR